MSEIASIQQAIKRIVETLQKIPPEIVPSGHVGVKRPVTEDDLPAVVILAKNIKESGSGIGNFVGIQKEDADRVSEIKGSKLSGIFQVSVWDISADRIEKIIVVIIETITANKTDLREAGFLYLSLVNEIYPSKLSADSLKEVIIRSIEYQVIFEFISRETLGPEGIIREIKVNLKDTFDENIILKQ